MKKSILACCADNNQATLDAAVHFAKMFDTNITLLYALEPISDLMPDFCATCSPGVQEQLLARINEEENVDQEEEQKQAEALLAECARYCKAQGISTSTLNLAGDLDECVANIERDYRLIIAQNASQSNSHVYDLLKAVSIPVMLLPGDFKGINSVVFAYDGKEALNKALERSLSAPLFANCKRICLYMGKDEDKASEALKNAKELFGKYNIEISCDHIKDFSANALINYADEAGADVIAMGAYSSNAIKHFLLGSFTNEMIRKTHLGLFIFK